MLNSKPARAVLLSLFFCFITLFSLATYAQGKIATKAFLLGRFNYTRDTAFIKVSEKYTDRAVYLQKPAYAAFVKMHDAAQKDGVRLFIISGTRSFDDQCYKWESKWDDAQFADIKNTTTKASRLLRWWSMPGTSRHHWGTDIDLTNMKVVFYQSAEGRKMFNWMEKNASKYGFYQPFNANRKIGYQEEKWHWSYLPLSKKYITEYKKQITYADINGFPGSRAAKELDVINTQVLAVNPAVK